MTALPDASHPSSRVAWPAVEPGFAAASVRAMPIDAASRAYAGQLRAPSGNASRASAALATIVKIVKIPTLMTIATIAAASTHAASRRRCLA
ncbi:Uncharacterised protein [Burkholderia pseudomallei]|nr:Uncharacterised protein [Burkholderia pseudomallei]CAJ5422918.1 Uncharacterised protein [Burkholderia pseudomallei]VBD50776.1 Uncharacterised protein [Burkholderia pseudomallei]VBH23687.1 Uncharacterised protein [Burkholderia pseudomallei]VBT65465.1 Uncharacterised protein [Burkholderia pseudomallei]